MKSSEAVISTLCLTLLLYVSTVDSFSSIAGIKRLDPHQCYNAAFMADGNRFKLQYQRNIDITPPRRLINDKHPYIFSTSFRKGQTLFINGKFNWIMGPGHTFVINLLGGVPTVDPDAGADVLHIRFTFDARSGQGGNIIFNTFKKGKWLEEVKAINPFRANHGFWLTITALDTKFEIRTYGHKILEYHYRLPLDYITFVNAIGDDTVLERLSLGGQIMKAPLRVVVPEGGFNNEGDYFLFDAIPSHFVWGMNFTDGENLILQITVNMEHKVMTLNSRIDRQWGEELRASSFPFEAGKMFNMEVKIYASRTEVLVFGSTIAVFPHRADDTAYSEFTFFGSLKIRTLNFCPVKFQAPWIGIKNLDYHSGYITSKTVPYGD
uniref:Galectin n=1 Tax=Panagrellus redivivus TaxID=6233 RepID=A0A7E4VWF1_PANRE